MTNVLDPPLTFEKTTTLVPRIAGPTPRPLLTNTFVVEIEFVAKIFPTE
jgi:hypothetical protein